MKSSLDLSSFLEAISSLSHSVVSPISLHCFLIPPCSSLGLRIQLCLSFPFSLAFCFVSPQLSVKPPQTTTLPLAVLSYLSFFQLLHYFYYYIYSMWQKKKKNPKLFSEHFQSISIKWRKTATNYNNFWSIPAWRKKFFGYSSSPIRIWHNDQHKLYPHWHLKLVTVLNLFHEASTLDKTVF